MWAYRWWFYEPDKLFTDCCHFILQVTVFMSRTFNRRQGVIAGCMVAAVHLLFLLYLHFAYHSVYEGQLVLHGNTAISSKWNDTISGLSTRVGDQRFSPDLIVQL